MIVDQYNRKVTLDMTVIVILSGPLWHRSPHLQDSIIYVHIFPYLKRVFDLRKLGCELPFWLCFIPALGKHLPQHGQSCHLYAAPIPLPRVPEKTSSSQELSPSCQQHGVHVGSLLCCEVFLCVKLILVLPTN